MPLLSKSKLGFYLHCQGRNNGVVERGAAKFPEWSCKACAELKIKSNKAKIQHWSRENEHNYNAFAHTWGFEEFGTLEVPFRYCRQCWEFAYLALFLSFTVLYFSTRSKSQAL